MGEYDENEEWNDDEYERQESELEKKIKEKVQEELYKLDYEDIVAGMPTRFKYREVESNDYGLTTQEILYARDTTLKQFVSLKKMAPYNEYGEFNVGSKKRRKFREMLKKDLEDTCTKETDDHDTGVENTPTDSEPKKKRRRLKKGKKKSKVDLNISESKSELDKESSVIDLKVKENTNEGRADGSKKRRREKSGKNLESLKLEASSENNVLSSSIKGENKVVENDKSDICTKNRSMNTFDDQRKKKKKKRKDNKSSITGISH